MLFRGARIFTRCKHTANKRVYTMDKDGYWKGRTRSGKAIDFTALSIFGVTLAGIAIQGNDTVGAAFQKYIVLPIMHSLDPEVAHKLAIKACENGLPFDIEPMGVKRNLILHNTVWGREIQNPIGIAAGFDKNGQAVDRLFRLGAGSVEVGSVTPIAQEGNPKPRMFRLKEEQACINRYGFNSDGHAIVRARLVQRLANGMDWMCSYENRMMGVNLGKNKLSEDAISDYVLGIKRLGPFADYLVVNVSSPNTPGLRDLQGRNELHSLLKACQEERNKLTMKNERQSLPPLLVKIAPDLTPNDKEDIAYVVKDLGIDGIIVSNTTVSREGLTSEHKDEIGGLSGQPLFEKSTECLRDMYKLTEGKVVLVGAGGISNGQQAFEKILNGATLLQLYTAFAYKGPFIIKDIKNELDDLLRENGYNSISEAIGAGVKLHADGQNKPKSNESGKSSSWF